MTALMQMGLVQSIEDLKRIKMLAIKKVIFRGLERWLRV